MEHVEVIENEFDENTPLEVLLAHLPAKLHYSESYGLQMGINGDGVRWCVRYWTWWPDAKEKQHPKLPMFIGPLRSALSALLTCIKENNLMPDHYASALEERP
jgi:hypothetical protein